ncbi:MAG: UPF0280 family protein [Dehalococcoidales bacterium]|nr:UPF0280 family protein [Dehalococcoidales bacterium]
MEPRTYRHWIEDKDLVSFKVVIKESDLYIRALSNLQRKAYKLVAKYREILESYIQQHPLFLTSLEPIEVGEDAPQIVRAMAEAGKKAGVGPMAAVAGAVSDFVGNDLAELSSEVIVENGGDIYLKSSRKRVVGIYAGKSPLTGKIGLEIDGDGTPIGISTSSGTVGHSLSFGKADAATVVADSSTLSDAVATALGNLVKEPGDINKAIQFGGKIAGVRGIVIIMGETTGVWGQIKLCRTSL